jgi:dTDP-4-amino-4,6-dideoxygalactose transaminase
VELYRKRLAGINSLELPATPAYAHKHAWHLLTVLTNDRDKFIEKMKEHNIGIGMHYVAAHLFTYYRERFGYKPGDFPHAENAGARICSLPLFPDMTEADVERVVATIGKI